MADLTTISFAAASVGVLHTLAGPDHYVPLIAIAKQRGWSLARAVVAAVGFGTAHCVAAVVLVVGLHMALGAIPWIETLEAWRADTAAMLLLGIGLAIALAAVWRVRLGERRRRRAVPWLLFAVFVLGPCEWLIPGAAAASADHGIAGALIVSAVFTAATVATMTAAVALGHAAMPRVRLRVDPGLVAGGSIAICAGLMLLGF